MRVMFVASAFVIAAPLSAQTSTAPVPVQTSPTSTPMTTTTTTASGTPALPPASGRSLPAGTQVSLSPLQELSSKHIALGERYKFQVVNDVVENGVVVIPRGSIATGVVSMKTGRAIGGKSGKFEITFENVVANGRTFPLSGIHRQEGKGNTVGALLGSILISGRSAVMVEGQIVTAMIKEQTAY